MTNDFFLHDGDPPYYQSRLFAEHGVAHAFFTRLGGVSSGVFESLNFAVGTGEQKDDNEKVLKNYDIAAGVFGLTMADVCRTYQLHTDVVEQALPADRGRGTVKPPYDHGVDGLFTAEKRILLSVRTADCVPVLLCDKQKRLCSAVHAGWRGTAKGITLNALDNFLKSGIDKNDILAAIGPCIGDCCYNVGSDVFDSFAALDSGLQRFFKPVDAGYMLDLAGANAFILAQAGIPRQNISTAYLCTKCDPTHFFSHRRSGAERGTMGAFICLD